MKPKYIIDEMNKALKYNLRQLEENLQKVRTYEETIQDLKKRNEQHKEAITEISAFLEELKKENELPLNLPIENESTPIVTEGVAK